MEGNKFNPEIDETTFCEFLHNFLQADQTKLITGLINELIIDRTDIEYYQVEPLEWFVINTEEYEIDDILDTFNEYEIPYIHKFDTLWLGSPESDTFQDMHKDEGFISLCNELFCEC